MSQIDDIELARALHVLFVTHWIGGVAFVTLVALPLARASKDPRQGWAVCSKRSKSASRRKLSGRSRSRADWALDGLALKPLGPIRRPDFWWLDAMVLVWALFMALVFVVEPIARPRLAAEAAREPGGRPAASLARAFRLAYGGDCHDPRRGRRRARRAVQLRRPGGDDQSDAPRPLDIARSPFD